MSVALPRHFPKFDSIKIHEIFIFISSFLLLAVTAMIQISVAHYSIDLSYTFVLLYHCAISV
jgi:hypothetical protein